MRKGSTYFRVRSAVRALVVSGVAVLPFDCLAPGENTSPPTLPLDVSLCSAPCGLTSLHADVFAQVEAREPLCFNWLFALTGIPVNHPLDGHTGAFYGRDR